MGEVDIVKHESKVTRSIVCQGGGGNSVIFQKRKIGREFSAPQTGLLKAFSIPCPSAEYIDMLALVVAFASAFRHFKVRLDDVRHMA